MRDKGFPDIQVGHLINLFTEGSDFADLLEDKGIFGGVTVNDEAFGRVRLFPTGRQLKERTSRVVATVLEPRETVQQRVHHELAVLLNEVVDIRKNPAHFQFVFVMERSLLSYMLTSFNYKCFVNDIHRKKNKYK